MASETERINRRQLLVLAAAVVTGCGRREGVAPSTRPAPADERLAAGVVDAGPLGDFGESRVYTPREGNDFFVVRRDGEVFALSAVCPHKGCLVEPRGDGSFECPCHHSIFSPNGTVQKGPAKTDLPRLAVKLDGRRHVLVDTNRVV